MDENSNLYYLRARYYDTETGRFISRDSFEGFPDDPLSLHKYVYAENNPVNLIDPNGNQALFEYATILRDRALQTARTVISTVSPAINTFLRVLNFLDRLDTFYSVGETIYEFANHPTEETAENLAEALVNLTFEALPQKSLSRSLNVSKSLDAINGAKKITLTPTAEKALNALNQLNVPDWKARYNLRKNLGSGSGAAHHIIPWGLRDHPLVKKAAQGGFNINGIENGIRLGKNQHNGYHRKLNKAVEIVLSDLYNKNPNITSQDAALLLTKYAAQMQGGLRKSSRKLG